MPIIRSAFWLGVAFLVIGPQVNYGESISQISNQAFNAGESFIAQQTDMASCRSAECVGTALSVSAGVQVVNGLVKSISSTSPVMATPPGASNTIYPIAPQPRQRLQRTS